MNGLHDMGGMDGFGKVEPEAGEPVFHAPWEGRVIALTRAMGAAGAWNIDMFRATRESQTPSVYLNSSYYKSWALVVEALAVKRGYVEPDELAAGHALHPARSLPREVLRRQARSLRTALDIAAAVRSRRPGANEEHPSGDAYATAEIRPRTPRRDRPRPRVSGVSRQFGAWKRRRPPVAVHGRFRRARIVGR